MTLEAQGVNDLGMLWKHVPNWKVNVILIYQRQHESGVRKIKDKNGKLHFYKTDQSRGKLMG